jgi:Cd2+/Zn2+-exporting ATPase
MIALAAGTLIATLAGIAIDRLTEAPGALAVAAFVIAYLTGGAYATRSAIGSLFGRRVLDVDLLMIMSAAGAAILGAWEEGATLLFLFSLSNALQEYALGRTHRAIRALIALAPQTARRILPAGATEEVDVERLEVGDLVLVKPGERVPADGTIVEGASGLDEAAITGESLPVDKATGDQVLAGTFNTHGALRIEVSRRTGETTLARLITLVARAREEKGRLETFTDWFGQRYTILVIVLAAGTAALGGPLAGWSATEAWYRAVTVLVAASPCALVISTPVAVLSAMASLARRGVLAKGGGPLERLGAVRTVAFDKTGTLTTGRLAVREVRAIRGDETELLALAASVEALSEHPIARAVVDEAARRGLAPRSVNAFRAHAGEGVEGDVDGDLVKVGRPEFAAPADTALAAVVQAARESGSTALVVAANGLLGVIAVADTVREAARSSLARLRAEGIGRIVVLTGDHHLVGEAVARQVGADEVVSELLPERKVELVRELQRQYPVAMVGDGVNDAPALAVAEVGIAMGGAGSDVALETADVVLMSDDLRRLPEAVRTARRCRRVVRQNLTFALGMMFVLVGLAWFAGLPLPLAVLGHEGGTIIVVLSGLRLLRG